MRPVRDGGVLAAARKIDNHSARSTAGPDGRTGPRAVSRKYSNHSARFNADLLSEALGASLR